MKLFKVIVLISSILLLACFQGPMPIKIINLECEYLVNPLAMDILNPRLSWKLEAINDEVYNQRQKAYQILVAGSPQKLTEEVADLWNSGRVESDKTAQIDKKHLTENETVLELGSGKYQILAPTSFD